MPWVLTWCSHKATARSFGARHPCRFFTRFQRASHFLLRGQEKGNHCAAGAARTAKLARRAKGRMPVVKRRPPRCSGLRAPALRLRDAAPGLSDSTSVYWQPTGSHPCEPPCGLFLRHAAATKGPHYCASCAAKPNQQQVTAKCGFPSPARGRRSRRGMRGSCSGLAFAINTRSNHDNSIAAFFLGLVHGCIRAVQQIRRCIVIARYAHQSADADC